MIRPGKKTTIFRLIFYSHLCCIDIMLFVCEVRVFVGYCFFWVVFFMFSIGSSLRRVRIVGGCDDCVKIYGNWYHHRVHGKYAWVCSKGLFKWTYQVLRGVFWAVNGNRVSTSIISTHINSIGCWLRYSFTVNRNVFFLLFTLFSYSVVCISLFSKCNK